MRLREVPLLLIAPLGLTAALIAHGLLQTIAHLRLGAPGFASHAHGAVEPAVCVEIALILVLCAVALRDALKSRAQPYYTIASRPRLRVGRFTLRAGLVALIAIGTLFGMECSESGSAALGLGWLGGALVSGAVALITALATAVGTLYLALAGHLAGFDRLIALFAAALARFIAALLAPAHVPQRAYSRRLAARTAPAARHAGLRAPPGTTR